MELYFFVFDFFHLTLYCNLSMLLSKEFHCIMYSPIWLLMEIWVVSSLRLLQVIMQGTFLYMSFSRHKVGFISSFLLDVYPRVELLNHKTCIYFLLLDTVMPNNFPKWLYQLTVLSSCTLKVQFSFAMFLF